MGWPENDKEDELLENLGDQLRNLQGSGLVGRNTPVFQDQKEAGVREEVV